MPLGKIGRLWRVATSSMRALPDFIIIGAQKAGTTSLYDYLCQHPQIHSASEKEVRFFDKVFYRGMNWYRSFFPLRSSMEPGEITGEASPAYMVVPRVAEMIAANVPDVKLIALLRNPVNRAFSSYAHQVRVGRETLSFAQALELEEERTGPARDLLKTKKWFTENTCTQFSRFCYQQKGRYAEQLREYFRYFDRSQVFIESSDNFFSNPKKTVTEVFEFLGVDPGFTPPDLSAKHTTDYKEVGGGIDESSLGKLREYYAPLNRDLYALLGRDFGWE